MWAETIVPFFRIMATRLYLSPSALILTFTKNLRANPLPQTGKIQPNETGSNAHFGKVG